MKSQFLSCLAACAAFIGTPALAQQTTWFNAPANVNMASPNLFSGPYAGVSVGLQVNNFLNFYASGTNYRFPVGAFAGYNYEVAPWAVVGGEVRLDLTYDPWGQAGGYNLFGFGRAGFLVAPDVAVYEILGLGVIDGTPATAVGIGIEQSVTDNFSVRYDAISYGQIASATTGTFYGGFTSMEMTVGALWYLDGDLSRSGMHFGTGTTPPTDFVGPYLGLYAGGIVNMNYSYFVPNSLNGYHLSNFAQGGIAGWNYDLGNGMRAGVEVQGGINFDTSGDAGVQGEAVGRFGFVPMDGLMAYATGGVGALAGRASYVLGGGLEYALWGDGTVRLDVQMHAQMSPRRPATDTGFTATKATIGMLWHLGE